MAFTTRAHIPHLQNFGVDRRSLLIRLDTEGKIVKRSKKVYTMMLFGMLNFSHTWSDPKGDVEPKEFADMVVDSSCLASGCRPRKGADSRKQHA